MYNPVTMERLLLIDDGRSLGDRILLTPLPEGELE
jgi:hypothetical protein